MLLGPGLHVWLWITLRKSLLPVPAVGRQCRPQNLNRGCARQWEVTYGPSVFQMSEFYANFCKDACEKQKKPNTAIFFVIPCNKRWRDDKADIFSAPLLYVFLFLKRFPDATCNWAEIWKLFIWTHCGTFLSDQRKPMKTVILQRWNAYSLSTGTASTYRIWYSLCSVRAILATEM